MSPSKKKRNNGRTPGQPKATAGTAQQARQAPPAAPAPEPRREAAGKAAGTPAYRRILATPLALLAGVLAVALAVRLLPLIYCIRDGHILLVEQDSYYHLRRITYVVQHFPSVNIFDSYVSYPHGYFIGWPPLYDLVSAAVAMIAGLGNPGTLAIEAASSGVNVTVGLLGIVAVYYLAKDLFGERAALFSAFVMAILPATTFVAVFGYAGHHSLEMLVSVTMFLLFLRSAVAGKAAGLTLSGVRKGGKAVVYAALAGVALAAAVFAWDGTPYFVGILVAFAFVLYAWNARRGESPEYLTAAGLITAAVAFVLVAPFAVTGYHGQHMEISAIYLSWFQVIMLAGLAAFFALMGALGAATKKARVPWFAAPAAALAATAVALAAVRVLLPGLFANLEAGLAFLTGGSTVLSSISEVSPLLFSGGQFSLAIVWAYLGTALVLATIGVLAYLEYTDRIRQEDIFFLVWTGAILVMGLLQARFVYLLGINVALFAGLGIAWLADMAGIDQIIARYRGGEIRPKRSAGRRKAGSPAALAGVAVLVCLLLLQPLASAYNIATSPLPVTESWDDAALWIKDHTPATSDVYSADQGTKPEYGVMTWWDYGNFILYRAERPAVANNFQTGIADAARFFIAQNESAANAIMTKDNARYVVVDRLMGSARISDPHIPGIFDNMPLLAGDDPEAYYMSFLRLDPAVGGVTQYFEGNDRYYGTMYARLFYDRGLGGVNTLGNLTAGLKHYRLIYENNGTDPVRVFERVAGATIAGRAAPGAAVELRLAVSDGTVERTYLSMTTADAAGAYAFTVPYPTGATTGAMKTGDRYVITSGGLKAEATVTEDAVQNGGTVEAGGLQ